MRRFLFSRTTVVEVADDSLALDDVCDSLLDDVNDDLNSEHETSDTKLTYIPTEIVSYDVKELKHGS